MCRILARNMDELLTPLTVRIMWHGHIDWVLANGLSLSIRHCPSNSVSLSKYSCNDNDGMMTISFSLGLFVMIIRPIMICPKSGHSKPARSALPYKGGLATWRKLRGASGQLSDRSNGGQGKVRWAQLSTGLWGGDRNWWYSPQLQSSPSFIATYVVLTCWLFKRRVRWPQLSIGLSGGEGTK